MMALVTGANAFLRQYDAQWQLSYGPTSLVTQFLVRGVWGLAAAVDVTGESIHVAGFTDGASGIQGDCDAFVTKLALLCPSGSGER